MEYVYEFLKNFPFFKIIENTSKEFVMQGYLEFNLEYKGIILYKKLLLKIVVNKNYPISLPKVYDIENILLKTFHKNADGSLCLGTELELRKALFNDYSLKNWINQCLNPFIYSSLYFEKYKEPIFGEREHGTKGELNSIKDYLGLSTFRETYLFLNIILSRKYKRKIFKRNNKIKKILCPLCDNKFFKCKHYLKLRELDLYFNNNLLKYLKELMQNYEMEVEYDKYKR